MTLHGCRQSFAPEAETLSKLCGLCGDARMKHFLEQGSNFGCNNDLVFCMAG